MSITRNKENNIYEKGKLFFLTNQTSVWKKHKVEKIRDNKGNKLDHMRTNGEIELKSRC